MKRPVRTGWFALLLVFSILLAGCNQKVIGEIHGPEWETVVIDSVSYWRAEDTGFSASDRGSYLGNVTDGGEVTFRVYAVQDDDEGRYLYCLWDWEGSFYERQS